MISRMLLTLSGPSRKNATMRSHNSTRNQYIMQRDTFFSETVSFWNNYFCIFVAKHQISLCGKFGNVACFLHVESPPPPTPTLPGLGKV